MEEQLSIQRHPLIARRTDSASSTASTAAGLSPVTTAFPHLHLMQERTYDGRLRYCHKCNNYKSDRCHHCSVCKKCVLRMDHHCVFLGNCVGFYNHKFFVSFVSYAFLGCLFVAIVAFPTFLAAIGEAGPRVRPRADSGASVSGGRGRKMLVRVMSAAAEYGRHMPRQDSVTSLVLVVGYIIVSSFALALLVFVGFHWFLVCKGLTTIELYDLTDPVRASRVARYNLGAWNNIKNVFGSNPFYWPFPTRYGVPGDGLSYPRAPPRPGLDDNLAPPPV
jgi:palmitoyltransferase ZDHHC2/15/20